MLPERLRSKFQGELAPVWAVGVVEPDVNRVENHKIHLSALRGAPPDSGGAHFALDRFARKAEAMIKAGEPLRDIAFVLGQAAHFIQDVNVPLHTIWGETYDQHWAYESQAFFHDWPAERHGYRGFRLVKSYKCFAFETARRSHDSVGLALSDNPPRSLIEDTWDHAVNDTVNLWLSIFYRALGPEKSSELYGIPAPLGEIGKGWFC
jgi:hypothetical protein